MDDMREIKCCLVTMTVFSQSLDVPATYLHAVLTLLDVSGVTGAPEAASAGYVRTPSLHRRQHYIRSYWASNFRELVFRHDFRSFLSFPSFLWHRHGKIDAHFLQALLFYSLLLTENYSQPSGF